MGRCGSAGYGLVCFHGVGVGHDGCGYADGAQRGGWRRCWSWTGTSARTRSVCGWDRQFLRDWVHRHDADGVAGLADRHGGGAAPRLSAEQEAEVAGWVRKKPDLEADKGVRWRCADIQARTAELFGVALHECSVGRRLRFSHISVRPAASQGGPRGAGIFQNGFGALVTAALLAAVRASGRPIEVWFQNEARVGQQCTCRPTAPS